MVGILYFCFFRFCLLFFRLQDHGSKHSDLPENRLIQPPVTFNIYNLCLILVCKKNIILWTDLGAFRSFLQSEFSIENIAFWLACRVYKRMTPFGKLSNRAADIYKEFLHPMAQSEVSMCISRALRVGPFETVTVNCAAQKCHCIILFINRRGV